MRKAVKLRQAIGFEELEKRIEGWRKTRSRGRAMPENLWEEVAAFAREHGVYAVAQCFGLDYHSLKRRSQANLPVLASNVGSRPKFVEVALDGAGASSRCSIEVVKKDGSRLTIRTDGNADLAAVMRAFVEARR